jgi:hypothetical protein
MTLTHDVGQGLLLFMFKKNGSRRKQASDSIARHINTADTAMCIAPVASTMASGFSSPPYTVYAPLATPSMDVPSRLGRFCRDRARMDGRLRFSGFLP